jgi:hypothetical protein
MSSHELNFGEHWAGSTSTTINFTNAELKSREQFVARIRIDPNLVNLV